MVKVYFLFEGCEMLCNVHMTTLDGLNLTYNMFYFSCHFSVIMSTMTGGLSFFLQTLSFFLKTSVNTTQFTRVQRRNRWTGHENTYILYHIEVNRQRTREKNNSIGIQNKILIIIIIECQNKLDTNLKYSKENLSVHFLHNGQCQAPVWENKQRLYKIWRKKNQCRSSLQLW